MHSKPKIKSKTNLLHFISTNKNWIALSILGITFTVMLLSFILFNVKIKDDTLKITSIFAKTIEISEIDSVELTEELPSKMTRSFGIDFFNQRLGKYSHDDLGKVSLYIDTKETPYLHITLKGDNPSHIYISQKDEYLTKELEEELNQLLD